MDDPLINEVKYLKNYVVPKKTRTRFFKDHHKEYIYIHNYKAKVDYVFKLELLKIK